MQPVTYYSTSRGHLPVYHYSYATSYNVLLSVDNLAKKRENIHHASMRNWATALEFKTQNWDILINCSKMTLLIYCSTNNPNLSD